MEEEGSVAASEGAEQSGRRDNRTGESVETVQSTSAVGFSELARIIGTARMNTAMPGRRAS